MACEKPVDGSTDEIVCRNEDKNAYFLVNRSTFQALFERLERLDKPAA
jgi:hypothetical protein